jgi:hypothetical protein
MKRILRPIVIGLLVNAAVLVGSAWGQAPAADPPPRVLYIREKHFRLPIALDDRERLTLQEVQLYVKNSPQEPWKLAARGKNRQTEFDYRVPADGEYAFGVATLDRLGQLVPSDVVNMIPGMIVVVDTRPPDVSVRVLPPTPQGDVVECKVTDANLSTEKVRVEYQGQALVWQVLPPLADGPDRYRLPEPIGPASMLRVWAADRAGNATTRIIKLGQPGGAPGSQPVAGLGNLPAMPTPAVDARSAKVPGPIIIEQPSIGPVAGPVVTERRGVMQADFQYSGAAVQPIPDAHFGATTTSPSRLDLSPPPPSATAPPPPAAPPASMKTETRTPPQLLNGTHVTLQYQIEQQGPTGVGKVEVWATRDNGSTWQRLHESPGQNSPLQFDLPGEGTYGLSLVMTNGHGLSSPPPKPGDAPDYWVEVDVTKPAAQLLSVRPGTAADIGSLLITWLANDKNLGDTPIDLYYSSQRDGPWQPIARGIRNDGSYRWTLPQNFGADCYARMDVTDRAGNLTRCVTPDPVLIDLVRPKAHVVGLTASIAGTAP